MPADPIALAQALLRCPSVTPAEGGALAFLAGVLEDAGFDVHRVTFSEPGTADVENLYARIGTGAPHLMFAGHTDVVPPGDEAAWTHPPFSGDIADGLLYGRGAVDMKGAIACFLAATLDYLGTVGAPKGSLSFLITGDEEDIAVNGTVKLLRWAAARGETFDHAIVGEPTNPMALGDVVKVGRRGSLTGNLVVTGKQGHVAYPQLADNPINGLTRLMTALTAEPLDAGSEHFDPSNLEFTNVEVGNRAWNVIPGQAQARFNIRYNDRHTQESLKALVEARAREAAGNRVRWSRSRGSRPTPRCSSRGLGLSSTSSRTLSPRRPAAGPRSPPPAAPRMRVSSRIIARWSNSASSGRPCIRSTSACRLPISRR